MYYESLEENEENEIEEVIFLHIDIYKKALVENLKEIPLSLYNKLHARRLDTVKRDREIKEVEILTLCGAISNDEMKRCIIVSNRIVFSSKPQHISLMMGKVNEMINEISEGWTKFF